MTGSHYRAQTECEQADLEQVSAYPVSVLGKRLGTALIVLSVLGMGGSLAAWLVIGPLFGLALMLSETLLLVAIVWVASRLR